MERTGKHMAVQVRTWATFGAAALLWVVGCGREAKQQTVPSPAVETSPVPASAPDVGAPALTGADERMADPEYLRELQGVDARRRSAADRAKALQTRMDSRLAVVATNSEPARAATAKIEALRKTIAEAEAAIAEQEQALRGLAVEDAEWRALSSELQGIDAERDALREEMQKVIRSRMVRQARGAQAPSAPASADAAPGR